MKKVTLEDYQRFVLNRPTPDTPGFYKLWRLKCKDTGYIRTEIEYQDDEKVTVGAMWRFPISPLSEMEYEYHPTFEAAFDSMSLPSRIDDKIVYQDSTVNYVFGYRIHRLGYGPHGTRDFYIEYRHYDRFRKEYDRASCSSYHWNTPGIFGKYLGRIPEQMPFKIGDFVEIGVSRFEDKGKEYSVLGVVIGIPKTEEEVWECISEDVNSLNSEKPIETYFETPDQLGVDDEEYFILYGPANNSLNYAAFRHLSEVRPPTFEIPQEAKETLITYFNEYMASIKDND